MTTTKHFTIDDVKLPDVREKTATVLGDYILFARIEHDHDAGNPCEEMDGEGAIRSFNTRHTNSIDPHSSEFKALVERHGADLVPLSYFEHGQSLWDVASDFESKHPGAEFQWDGVRFAGIWIPDQCVLDNIAGLAPKGTPERRKQLTDYASGVCKTYTAWVNGEVYGYKVELYRARREGGRVYDRRGDYRFDEPVAEDSCWGFYGDVEAEVKSAVERMLETVNERRNLSATESPNA